MVDALYQLGYGDVFDVIVGNSAGAINAAYFMSGQITMGTSVYYENLVGDRFIRLTWFPNIMDLNYLFDSWIMGGKPLNVEHVIHARAELSICTTRVADGSSRYFTNRPPEAEFIIPALKASCSTPLFTRNVERLQGDNYNDGLINDAIPINRALARGCTDLVCVLTRPAGYRKTWTALEAGMRWLQTRHYSPAYRHALTMQRHNYNVVLDDIDSGRIPCKSLLVLAPEVQNVIANGETRADRVRQGVRKAMDTVAGVFHARASDLKLYDELEAPS
jgi:predicted patatin/cPLA2 family phospholipase